MVDPVIFAIAQKMSWVKLIFDNKFESLWKTIELFAPDSYGDMLWISNAPESVLNNLFSSQLFDSIRTWCVFRKKAVENLYDCKCSDLGACQCLWFNGNIRSKSKQYLRIGMIKVSFILVICLILFTQVLNCLKSLFLILMFHIRGGESILFNAKYSQFMA